ncbi:MAG: CDP-alcohol phosphatidyltransferase family protein [Anaerolineae bacterium]
MGIYAIKPQFQKALGGIEDRLVAWHIKADWLTGVAVGAAALAAVIHLVGWPQHAAALWLIPPLALIRLSLNALDGQVARRSGTARPWGAVLNEMGDRLADVLFLAPIALVGGVPAALGLTALCAMLLGSLSGVLAASLGFGRLTLGVFAKADRMLALAALYVVALVLGASWPLAVLFWAILVGSLVTLAQRLAWLHREIDSHCEAGVSPTKQSPGGQ